MLDQKQLPCRFDWSSKARACSAHGINPDDASRKQFWKRVRILPADFRVPKTAPTVSSKRGGPQRWAPANPLAKGSDLACHELNIDFRKPAYPLLRIVDVRVDEDRTFSRKDSLETGNVVQMEAKQFQPIFESIVRKHAESGELINAGSESWHTEPVIKAVRKVIALITRKQGPRLARQLSERKAAAGKDLSDFLS